MNKSDLVREIAESTGTSLSNATQALDATILAISNALAREEDVQLIGFGTFSVTQRAERMGIDPRTKAQIKIPASKGVKFKVGKKLKDAVKAGKELEEAVN